ncbi:restriction endonuclease subunit S [Lacticaseibacillus thailandensis]|uniref:restriction endonuclease subunit S n=1 Tax=Lacticaseibacillus thailandensis TaxID=381741 RepID=UPI001CDABBDA|nr:restriction endonuclease subunit S [Lacticaseibacillus thailandensis]
MPHDWEQRKLGDAINSLESGVSVNSGEEDTGYYILKTSAIELGHVDLTEVKSIVREEILRAKTPLKKGCILISRMNTPALVGASGLNTETRANVFLPDRLWQGAVASHFNQEWLISVLNTPRNIKQIQSLGTGTSGSMKNISKDSMLNVAFAVPSLEEQKAIGKFMEFLENTIALHH